MRKLNTVRWELCVLSERISPSAVRLVAVLLLCIALSSKALAEDSVAIPPASGVPACEAQLRKTPRSFGPYLCLSNEVQLGHGAEVRRILQGILKRAPDEPRALFYYALIRSLAGEHVDEDEYVRAANGFRREQNATGVVWAITSQVAERCFAGLRCDAATETLLVEAERLAEQSGDVQLKRLCQLWWAREALMVDDVGREERALARLDALPGEDPPWLARQVFETRAHLAGHLHDYQLQQALYAGLLSKNEPGSWQSMVALGGMGGAAASLAGQGLFEREKAEALLRQALGEEVRLGFDLSAVDAGALATRVRLALLLGPTDEAMDLLQAALVGQVSRKGWNYPFHARWLLARYTIERNPADVESALAFADVAVSNATAHRATWERSRSLLMRAYVLWHGHRLVEARQAAMAALELMETLRNLQPDLRVRMRYEETQASAYHLVAASLLDRGTETASASDVADAFDVMERLRARGLLETLLRDTGGADAGRLVAARTRIDDSQRKLLESATPPAERLNALGELHGAEREEVLLATSGPSREGQARSIPSLAEVQSVLGPTEALVSYQEWRRSPSLDSPYEKASSWALVITRTGARPVRIPDADEVEPQMKLWLALVRAREGKEGTGGARLFEELIGPVLAVLPTEVRHLLVVPDGPLHALPFDALQDAKGSYLVEHYGISLIPSAAVWLELKRRHVAQSGLALALAEPSSNPRAQALVEAELETRGGTLAPLLLARQEAQSAVAAFPKGSLLLAGPAASEDFLKKVELRPFSLIHLATHAVVDNVAPERSAILLASGSEAEDGLLQVEEISRLKLDQKVVVLAACNTSAGPVRRAEGVMSLARAFFEAGAQSVVGTLAPIGDSESAELFRLFYRRIADGVSVRDALLLAKRERIRAGAPAAAWADVVVLGNDDVVPRSAEPDTGWPLASASLGISLLVGTAVLAGLRRRSPPPAR